MFEFLYQEEFYWLYVALAGFLTGLAYAFGGSGGLIIVPFLIAMGMPIHTAIGTAKLAAIGMLSTVFWKFKSTDQLMWDRLPVLIVITVLGAVIGTAITVKLDQSIIYPIAGAFLLFLAPLALIKKDFGLVAKEIGSAKQGVGYALFFCVMVFAGFFGAGAGIPALFVLSGFWGFTMFQAHATMALPFLILNVISSILFAIYGHVDYMAALLLLLTMSLGGWIGARFAVKGGSKVVKFSACGFAFLIGFKMVWESM